MPDNNPIATDLKTLGAVPGVIIQGALDSQRAEIYKEMTDKLDEVKETVGGKVDDLAKEMREGFASIHREMGNDRTARKLLEQKVSAIDTTTKDNHKKVSAISDIVNKLTDPKRFSVLVVVLTSASAWIRNRSTHFLPWLAAHPNTEAVLQVVLVFTAVLGVYYVLRALPAEEVCEPKEKKVEAE